MPPRTVVLLLLALAAPAFAAPASTAPPANPTLQPESDLLLDRDGRRLDELAYTGRFMFGKVRDMRARHWLVFGSILAGSAVLAAHKGGIQDEVRENSTAARDARLSPFKALGNRGIIPALGASAWFLGSVLDKPAAADGGFVILESFAITGLASELGKYILSEERPADGGDLRFFSGKGHGISGHAAVAASVAGPIDQLYLRIDPDDSRAVRGWKRVGKVLAYGLPVLTGLSRIEDDKHYAWNVGLGLALGYSVGHMVGSAHMEYVETAGFGPTETRPHSPLRPSGVGPLFSPEGGPGLIVSWQF